MSADVHGLFAEIWNSNFEAKDIRTFLDKYPEVRSEQLLAVILHDQRQRWKCGKPWSAEEYLQQFPELSTDRTSKLRLIIGEFHACRDSNGSITAAELIARFPELNKEILQGLSRLDLTHSHPLPDVAFNSFFSDATQKERQTAGRYTLLELIGEGTFGQVWLSTRISSACSPDGIWTTSKAFCQHFRPLEYAIALRKKATLPHYQSSQNYCRKCGHTPLQNLKWTHLGTAFVHE